MYVPVLDKNNRPLMPTTPVRARRLIKQGRAIRRWFKGVFAIKLIDREGGDVQTVACGIDPGSKKEALTVVDSKHTFINIQADAVTHVKKRIEQRRNARRSRRQRKTPCRANRMNRQRGGLPPSTRSRWQWKLRLVGWLRKLYPITHYVVEDVKAKTRPGKWGWNINFSPLAAGKNWFYDQLRLLGGLTTKEGWETKDLRDAVGLVKSKDKLSSDWSAHCVDSFVLAKSAFDGVPLAENREVFCVTPFQFHRRQLHAFQPAKGGARRDYGGTRSCGFKRGSIVRHPKYDICFVGGHTTDRISLHSFDDGHRLCRNVYPFDLKFLAYSSWRWYSPVT